MDTMENVHNLNEKSGVEFENVPQFKRKTSWIKWNMSTAYRDKSDIEC